MNPTISWVHNISSCNQIEKFTDNLTIAFQWHIKFYNQR